jgi:predicted phage baseplate assembly protein
MISPWWGKEASPSQQQSAPQTSAAPGAWPQLVEADRAAVYSSLLAAIASYTPEWTNRRPDDAGIALAHLFSEELEPVLQRLNQLPENCFIQFLQSAGVKSLPATPAQALLQFTVSDSAVQPVLVGAGFQVGASGANGLVKFETNTDLYATPASIQEIYAFGRGVYRAIDPAPATTPFLPFGSDPAPGLAFFIGLSAAPGVLTGPQISLGIEVQGSSGQVPPVATGGVAPLPAPLSPLLGWDVLDGNIYREARVLLDETSGLVQSGIVTLQLPDTWNPGIPQGSTDTAKLLWIRLQILYGSYPSPPALLSVQVNMVRATAVQSFYDEVLAPLPGINNQPSIMVLSQTPVLPGSLFLAIDDTANLTFSPANGGSAPPGAIWAEVDDLAQWGPDDMVYELDPASGQVSFGDGIHGMRLPPGFRNVIALKYQVGGGAAGAVAAGQITSVINSVPFLSAVTNPSRASGGMDAETQGQTLQRGPQELRARNRAVALADYEILALRAVGAQVARAHAVANFHPSFPGTPIPGVVCVFVIPLESGTAAPVPDDNTLRAVSSSLSATLAPAGVEVVAAAPLYHTVRVEVSVVIDPSVSRSQAVQSVLSALNQYMDPVSGGADEAGWPFGGTLSNVAFVRLLLGIAGITAVPTLSFTVDGIRNKQCADVAIPANSLPWPGQHSIIAVGPGEEP